MGHVAEPSRHIALAIMREQLINDKFVTITYVDKKYIDIFPYTSMLCSVYELAFGNRLPLGAEFLLEKP